VRTNIEFSAAGSSLKNLAVTSTAPGEGKTTTATNLAVTMSLEGQRVLLIDCDLRRPQVHKLFDAPREPGLSALLASPPTDAEDLSMIPEVRHTSIGNLHMLPAGRYRSDHSEIFQVPRLQACLRDLGRFFDAIVLDSPPLFAGADATIVAGAADGVVLVARAASSDRVEARQAQELLARAKARVVGAVLNDPEGTLAREKAGYYGYSYAYGPEED
jgi:capsular exopolysaccharide synthesis family protein